MSKSQIQLIKGCADFCQNDNFHRFKELYGSGNFINVPTFQADNYLLSTQPGSRNVLFTLKNQMPTIFCSLKLSKHIGLKRKLPSISIDNWNGHIFHLEGRKCIVFVHKETFYSFVVFDILKKDLLDFKSFFIVNFLIQLETDKLLTDIIKIAVSKEFQTFELSTTDGDKSTNGFLNDCINRLTWNGGGLKPTIHQARKYVDEHYNDCPLLSRQASTPIELMRERLKTYR